MAFVTIAETRIERDSNRQTRNHQTLLSTETGFPINFLRKPIRSNRESNPPLPNI